MHKSTNAAIEAVITFFLTHRRDPSTKEVADAMGISASVARKALNGAFDGDLDVCERIVPVQVRANLPHVDRMVDGWAVTREALADMAQAAVEAEVVAGDRP